MESNSKEIKMKIFQTVRKQLIHMGFYPKQQENSGRLFGAKHTREIIRCVMCTGAVGIFPFYGAESKEESMYSIFALSAAVGISVSRISLMVENDQIFNTIDMGEKVLNDG